MENNTCSLSFDDRLQDIARQWRLYALERKAREGAMKHFQFQIAAETVSERWPGGWTRDDLAKAVLLHIKMYGASRTSDVLQKVAGWRVVDQIGPEKYGVCIAHLCHEVTRRPFMPTSPAIFRLGQIPKTNLKGNDDHA